MSVTFPNGLGHVAPWGWEVLPCMYPAQGSIPDDGKEKGKENGDNTGTHTHGHTHMGTHMWAHTRGHTHVGTHEPLPSLPQRSPTKARITDLHSPAELPV